MSTEFVSRGRRKDPLNQCRSLAAELERMTSYGAELLRSRTEHLTQADADAFHVRIEAVKTAVRASLRHIEDDLRSIERNAKEKRS